MSTQYAKETSVSAEKSRGEIERELRRFGATGFGYAWQGGYAVIVFEFKGRRMKFVLPMPTTDEVKRDKRGHVVDRRTWDTRLDAETRRRWRSLALSIKAKLVTVADGISTVESEFMAHIVLPNGLTVGEWMTPQIASAYEHGNMPPLLEGPRQ